MRLIDADALLDGEQTIPYPDVPFDTLGKMVDWFIKLIDKQPTIAAPRWVRCDDELPEDGEWAIFTNGKVVTVERFKLDGYNHYNPPSIWFDLEDAKYWMKLPDIPTEAIS